jgi:hypothetical protein
LSGERLKHQVVCEREQERFCGHPNFAAQPKASEIHSLQNAALRTAKQQTELLSSLWASFYQLASSTRDSAKNN